MKHPCQVTNFAMGAIDTWAVGAYGGTVQLAALSPAVTITEYVCYAMYWLNTATLKLMGDKLYTDELRAAPIGLPNQSVIAHKVTLV